jgi:hypothetical protein
MTKVYRHGEIAFVKIDKLPTGLVQSKTKTIMRGSHGNSHDFDNGKLYLKKIDDYIFGYFVAKDTTLFHPDHGKNKKANLPNGVYELRKQNEFTPAGLVPVTD